MWIDTLVSIQASTDVLAAIPPPLTITIDVPLPDRDICGNGSANKFKRSEIVAAQRHDAFICGYACERTPDRRPTFPKGVRVRVTVVVRRPEWWSARPLDDDNLWRGLKPTLDGLADAGLVANDRQFLMGPITWIKAEPGHHGITLTLAEVRQ